MSTVFGVLLAVHGLIHLTIDDIQYNK